MGKSNINSSNIFSGSKSEKQLKLTKNVCFLTRTKLTNKIPQNRFHQALMSPFKNSIINNSQYAMRGHILIAQRKRKGRKHNLDEGSSVRS